MSCFCHRSLQPLRLGLPALKVSLGASLPGAQLVLAVAEWLGARSLPAAPWRPDPAWASLALPPLRLDAGAMATISALAQLRAQLLATAGIDLLLPGGPAAFARLVVTMNARVAALAALTDGFAPLAWLRLAALNGAIGQVTLALQAGLLPPDPALANAMANPAGMAMASWRALLAALGQLAPLLAVASHLELDLSAQFTAQLAAALRLLRGMTLPPIDLAAMASLTAGLSAVAQLRAAFGTDPLQAGFSEMRAMVSVRLSALLPGLAASLRLNLQSPDLLAALLALLPPLPYCPTLLATPAVVAAALSIDARALAALDWQVPAAGSLAAVRVGLPAVAFAAQLQAALGVAVALPSPCGSGCDAAALMRAARAAA